MINRSRLTEEHFDTATEQPMVDGTFAAGEGRDLIQALIDGLLNAYKLQNLRGGVRTEAPDPEASQAIASLLELRAELGEQLSRAIRDGASIRVKASLDVEIQELSHRS